MKLTQKVKKTLAAGLIGAFAWSASPIAMNTPAHAQGFEVSTVASDDAAVASYANELRLAYVRSPSQRVNTVSERGLVQLSAALIERTSIEPKGVVELDVEYDSLALFPFVYWPVTSDTATLSEVAQRKVQEYIDAGGFIVFDIRDTSAGLNSAALLKRVLGSVTLEPLVSVNEEHTLTRSFYLMSSLRGSFDYNDVWVEKGGLEGTESVSSVIIGENNWAGAWAARTLPEGSRQRELSLRAGINMVMFALTGEYKGDQLHLDSILEKMEPRP